MQLEPREIYIAGDSPYPRHLEGQLVEARVMQLDDYWVPAGRLIRELDPFEYSMRDGCDDVVDAHHVYEMRHGGLIIIALEIRLAQKKN
ncbi:hypothetical protein [Desulfoluna butyratoxydans]|uniref:Uncharacterized protein n=1 Tax=Desulfoluna butyratoxydans TaxID=231438 RepID=A0A4U8YMH9_9BACT|nr:hypothetical protein [Desulfoluna butyratoxydans]VFQ42413.1 hypothetical protein MSL71_310 [Desulfoluna butyratoxydans]